MEEELRHFLSHIRHQRRQYLMMVVIMVAAAKMVAERRSPFLRRRRSCWSESELQFLSSVFSSEITTLVGAKLRDTGCKKGTEFLPR